jgi:predicted lipoprotein
MNVSPRVESWKRWQALPWLAVAVVLLLLLFPPFHIRPLGVVAAAAPGAIDVRRFAQRFWTEKLAQPAITPIDVREVIALLNDPGAADRTPLGHRTGIGGKPYFFIAGRGRVVAIDSAGVWLSEDSSDHRQLLLPTGPLFGDALRDATGLLRLDDFTSSDFNALSAALNTQAEAVVHKLLNSSLQAGAWVDFLGAAAIDDATAPEPFLRLVPVRAGVQP